jgi:hypothetical protein
VSGGGVAELATKVAGLLRELANAHSDIVNRTIEVDGVQDVLKKCNDVYLLLESWRREILAAPRRGAPSMGNIVSVNRQLRAVRESLGPLGAILAADNRRVTIDFERRHGRAEAAIEDIIPALGAFLVELRGTTGLRAPYRRRREVTARVREDDDTGSAAG